MKELKEKLEAQLKFATDRYVAGSPEAEAWEGYAQALKYVITEINTVLNEE